MKYIFTLIFLVCSAVTAFAQDIIVKTDKSEIKAKVLEIDEVYIKYKQWDFQDGPSYNLKKTEVFMIIYSNGRRETFNVVQAQNPSVEPVTPSERTSVVKTENQSDPKVSQSPIINAINSSVAKNEITDTDTRVQYNPGRISISAKSLSDSGIDGGIYSLQIDADYGRIFANWLNYGLNSFLSYAYSDTDYVSSYTIGYGAGIYTLAYVPVNRVIGNLENQHKGFFPFARTGYYLGSYSTTVEYNDSGNNGSSNSATNYAGAFSWHLGADYKFTNKFGLSFYTAEFVSVAYGITIGF